MIGVSLDCDQVRGYGLKIVPAEAFVTYRTVSLNKSSHTICALTHHSIDDNGVLSCGESISADGFIDKVSSIKTTSHSRSLEIQSESILVNGFEKLVWYRKRSIETLWFRVNGRGEDEPLRVELPPLLFLACKSSRSLKVFALGSNSRPDGKTVIYNAPFMNISSGGTLCQGTANLPKRIDEHHTVECEDSLIKSVFTHVNHKYTLSKKTSCNQHVDFWISKASNDSSPKRIKVSELSRFGTLSTLLKQTR